MPPLRFEPGQSISLQGAANGLAVGRLEAEGRLAILVSADTDTGIACYSQLDGSLFRRIAAPSFASGSDDIVFLAAGIGALADRYNDRVVLFGWDARYGWRQLRELGVSFPWRIVGGDFSGDGDLDVAVISRQDRMLTVFSKALSENNEGIEFKLPGAPITAKVGNFGQRDEILISIELPARVRIYTVEPLRKITQRSVLDPTEDLGPGASVEEFVIANADNDEHLDVVTANYYNFAGIYHGDGTGSFERFEQVAVDSILRDVAVADMNLDGTPDLILVTRGAGPADGDEILITVQNTRGSFLPLERIAGVSDPIDIHVTDVDADRKPDIIVLERETNRIRTILNRTVAPGYSSANSLPKTGECSGGVDLDEPLVAGPSKK